MSLTAAHIDADWENFAGVIAVSYTPYAAATDDNPAGGIITGIDALTEEPTKEEIEYGENMGAHHQYRWWNLRTSELSGTAVTKRGIITDPDGKQWCVIRCIKRSFGTRWKCFCFGVTG